MFASFALLIAISATLFFIFQLSNTVVLGESKLLQQSQQNQTYTATLTGDNNLPPVYISTTGVVKFVTNTQYNNNNELYYEINLTNIHNDVVRVDVHFGKDGENGPALVTLYQKTTSLPSEICCTSVDSEYEKTKLFFNGTIFTQAFEFGPLSGSRNITDLTKVFDNGSAFVEVYTLNHDPLSLFDTDGEIRGQITN